MSVLQRHRNGGCGFVQLELVQRNYMDEDTSEYLAERAAPTQALIRRLLEACLAD